MRMRLLLLAARAVPSCAAATHGHSGFNLPWCRLIDFNAALMEEWCSWSTGNSQAWTIYAAWRILRPCHNNTVLDISAALPRKYQ